jgi:5-methylthioadenosine/S-adenosylhomocysteine deaminase
VTRSLHIANARLCRLEAGEALEPGGVLVEDGAITAVAVGPDADRALGPRAEERLDAGGLILMPGLVNGHYHSYSTLLKGTENSLPLEAWALYTVAYGHALGEEAVRLAVLLGAAEMIRGGITACLDHFPHVRWAEAALGAHEASGLRVGFAPFMHDRLDHELLDVALPTEIRARLDGAPRSDPAEAERLYRDLAARWHGRAGRLTLLLGPNAFQRCSAGLWAVWRRLADELGLGAHTHLLETRAQAAHGQQRWPGGTVAEMDRQGLLGERLSVAHGIWLLPSERELLARRGVTVVHNPASNLMLGSGRMALPAAQALGVPLALGTDSSNTGGPHDLFAVMRLALMLPRPDTPDPRAWPQPGQVLAMATAGGARALGLAGRLGALAPGHRADLVLLRPGGAALGGGPLTVSRLVQHASAGAVAAVMVEGRWVLRDGRILAFDEEAVLDRVAAIGPELLAAARPAVELARATAPYFAAVSGGAGGSPGGAGPPTA